MSQSELINKLIEKGKICDQKVIQVFSKIDRRLFYSGSGAYEDKPKRIGFNATISAPHMHGRALEYLKDHLKPGSRALDIGSGSGYFTVCMAEMMDFSGTVIGIEHVPELAQRSLDNIQSYNRALLEAGVIRIVNSDGRNGYRELAPFDVIHVGACAEEIPNALLEQLGCGGRLMIPVGDVNSSQKIMIVDKDLEGNLTFSAEIKVYYVPLCDLTEQIRDN